MQKKVLTAVPTLGIARTSSALLSLKRHSQGSVKLEGRMKAPDYVYAVVRSYRAQLDDLAADRTPTVELR